MVRDSGRLVGEVVAAAVNLLNPAALVIAGDIAGGYDVFVAGLRETLYRNATAMSTRHLEVVAARVRRSGRRDRERGDGARPGAGGGAVDGASLSLRDDVLREPLEVADLASSGWVSWGIM